MTELLSRSADPGGPADTRVPPVYWAWLSGAAASMLGTQVMAFAMAWSATAHGGLFAGLVLTMIVLPRAVLSLTGGAVADRAGAWRVMVAADAARVALMVVFGAAVWQVGAAPWLLLAAALGAGLADAFYLPSSGSVPRLLVPGGGLARASSARQIVFQLAGFAGAPLGGLAVALAGLHAAAFANAATYGVMLAVLLVVRRRAAGSGGFRPEKTDSDVGATPENTDGDVDSLWRRSLDGLGVVSRDPLLRAALLLTAGAAAFLLPLSSLLVPLLARERHWAPGSAGVIVGALAVGTVMVALAVTLRGAHHRPGLVAGAGLLVAGFGAGTLASASGPAPAVAAAVVTGFGTGLFTTHVVPMVLGNAPRTHLARVQAVVLIAQSAPLLLTNNGLGLLADATRADLVIGVCAGSLIMCTLVALSSPALRGHRTR